MGMHPTQGTRTPSMLHTALVVALTKPCHVQGQSLVMVLEYCCSDLSALLKAVPHRLLERHAKGILQQLLRGVHACHSAGEEQSRFHAIVPLAVPKQRHLLSAVGVCTRHT